MVKTFSIWGTLRFDEKALTHVIPRPHTIVRSRCFMTS